MSYAIIKTGGKQFAVEGGETLRVPTINEKAGGKVSIDALLMGEGKDAKLGGLLDSIQATGSGTELEVSFTVPPDGIDLMATQG